MLCNEICGESLDKSHGQNSEIEDMGSSSEKQPVNWIWVTVISWPLGVHVMQ